MTGNKVSENNRYFLPNVPLQAPQGDYGFRHHRSPFAAQVEFNQSQSDLFEDPLLNADHVDLLRGKRQFAYHVMALQVRKEQGDVRAAMENKVVVDIRTEYDPFIVEAPVPEDGSEPEEAYICLEKKRMDNPLGTDQDKVYDPSKNQSIGQQLSAGKAANSGDIFEWRSTFQY